MESRPYDRGSVSLAPRVPRLRGAVIGRKGERYERRREERVAQSKEGDRCARRRRHAGGGGSGVRRRHQDRGEHAHEDRDRREVRSDGGRRAQRDQRGRWSQRQHHRGQAAQRRVQVPHRRGECDQVRLPGQRASVRRLDLQLGVAADRGRCSQGGGADAESPIPPTTRSP